VERIMNASDVFVLPSKFEAWPLVGLEAMACGIPAIMKPTGGISDYLHDGENGFFITEDPADIAAQIKKTSQDSAAYRLMSLQARRTALRFSWEVVASKYVQLLSSLTNGGGEVVNARQKVETSRP
jgi:glycosyltransferase involved in cell wall biosynthesis